MKRYSLSKGRDRRTFKRTSTQHGANTVKFVMRGGIRK